MNYVFEISHITIYLLVAGTSNINIVYWLLHMLSYVKFCFKKVIIEKIPSKNYNVSMIYSYNELFQKLGGYYQLKKALNTGAYKKVSHGMYTDDSPFLSELETIFVRYPNAILSLQSAFFFYDLSDFIPEKYVVVTPQKSHRINDNKVTQIYLTNEILNIGKIVVNTKYGTINIYDIERMLIELFRLKSKCSYPYFKEVVGNYRKLAIEGKIDVNKLMEYCSMFKNGNNLKKRIQDIIL